jgi:sulfur carrier protein
MEIQVNDQKKIVASASLQLLIDEMIGEKTGGIAIAVNNKVVPRSEWVKATLSEMDRVLIIRATQGG